MEILCLLVYLKLIYSYKSFFFFVVEEVVIWLNFLVSLMWFRVVYKFKILRFKLFFIL